MNEDIFTCMECDKTYKPDLAKRLYGDMDWINKYCSPQCYTFSKRTKLNRQILFRGKRCDNGDWVEGSLITTNNKASYGNTGVFSNQWIMEIEDDLNVHSFADKGSCSVWSGNACIQVIPATVQVKAGDFWFGVDELANIVADSPQYKMLKLAANQN